MLKKQKLLKTSDNVQRQRELRQLIPQHHFFSLGSLGIQTCGINTETG